MTAEYNKTLYLKALVALYHLLITADGHVDERELRMGELMKEHESIDQSEFNNLLDKVSKMEKEDVIEDCISNLEKCDRKRRIKCVAWISLISNSDGFMAPEEWKLIYDTYNNRLKLNLSEILEVQKTLPRPSIL